MKKIDARQSELSQEISGNEVCPCGSGIAYKKCCKKRKFRWMRDPDGSFSKSVGVEPDLRDALLEAQAEFKRIFGRNPRKTDPVFFQKYFVSARDLERETIRAMRNSGIPPELIYAYKKTGFIVKDTKLLSTVEHQEYVAAIKEFRRLRRTRKIPLEELLEPETPDTFLPQTTTRPSRDSWILYRKAF